tara:strand:- start:1037 stop:1228 length:192 start_codon:yes stop_codon:yes gene_type:complete
MTKATLKLFMLRQHQGGVPVRDENGDIIYYSDKQVAKGNRVNKQVVSYGIDHRKYNKNRKEGA